MTKNKKKSIKTVRFHEPLKSLFVKITVQFNKCEIELQLQLQ